MQATQDILQQLNLRGEKFAAEDVYLLRSNSMFPTLRAGDLLVFQSQLPDKIRQGDIVAYCCQKQVEPRVHRVVEMRPPEVEAFPYVLKGDNAFNTDLTSKECKMLGRLRYVWRGREIIDYNRPLRRQLAPMWAFISKLNLLPELIKRRLGRLFFDPLRENKSVVKITQLFGGGKLSVHHFQRHTADQVEEGNFSLQRGSFPVGGLGYRKGPWQGKTAVLVQNFWLRFPFSYKVLFLQVLNKAEDDWRELGFKRAVFPFQLRRTVITDALKLAGYQEQGAEGCGQQPGYVKSLEP